MMYKTIEAKSLSEFDKLLNEHTSDKWYPFMQMFVYYQNGQTYFCQQLSKPITP